MAAAPALAEESGDRSVSRRAAAGAKEAPLQAARGGRKADLRDSDRAPCERTGLALRLCGSRLPRRLRLFRGNLRGEKRSGMGLAASWTRGKRSRRKFGIGIPPRRLPTGVFPTRGRGACVEEQKQPAKRECKKLLTEKEAPWLPHKGEEVGKLRVFLQS